MDILLTQAKAEARQLAPKLQGGEVIALIGKLGSGKTTFTQELAKELGVKSLVTSPTFLIMQQYNLPDSAPAKWLYHLDLYRIKDFQELITLDIEQVWQHPQTITVIEWADKIESQLPKNTIYYHFTRNAQ